MKADQNHFGGPPSAVVPPDWDAVREGRELHALMAELFPLCRSITGNGLRESLRLIQKWAPLTLREVPSGTKIFDWTVPNEWNIRDAYLKNARGEKVVDFQKSNLHLVNYSVPVRQKLPLAELRKHLFTLPDHPDWVPYKTSYHQETWGFCLSQRQLENLPEGDYEVCIDSTLEPGQLTYGELRIQGQTNDEVLISAHSCHPSLCNDNLSGMVVAAGLARIIGAGARRYSYRFLWGPGTLGAIAWLALNEGIVPRIKHGLVLSCVGDSGKFNYKRTRQGAAEIDRAVEYVLRSSGQEFQVADFSPYGCDERQYCSPGFNLPVGCLMRTPNGMFPENHTSADNLEFVTGPALAESVYRLLSVCEVLESNYRYRNLSPKGEPQLGRRGLYRQMGGAGSPGSEEAMLWVLNLSDGGHSLLDIAGRSGLPWAGLATAARQLEQSGLLARLNAEP